MKCSAISPRSPYLSSIEVRHLEVAEDQIVRALSHSLSRLRFLVRDIGMMPFSLHRPFHEIPQGRFVLHKEQRPRLR